MQSCALGEQGEGDASSGERTAQERAAAEGAGLLGLDQLEGRIGKVLSLVAGLREEREALRSERERLQQQIEESQQQLRRLEDENETLRTVHAEAKRRVEALLAKLHVLEQ